MRRIVSICLCLVAAIVLTRSVSGKQPEEAVSDLNRVVEKICPVAYGQLPADNPIVAEGLVVELESDGQPTTVLGPGDRLVVNTPNSPPVFYLSLVPSRISVSDDNLVELGSGYLIEIITPSNSQRGCTVVCTDGYSACCIQGSGGNPDRCFCLPNRGGDFSSCQSGGLGSSNCSISPPPGRADESIMKMVEP